MSLSKDPIIAEMCKAVFEILGSLPEFNAKLFKEAFAREARVRHMHLGGIYFNNVRHWVELDVKERIRRYAKCLPKNEQQEHQAAFFLKEPQD